ncbi:MAG: hypothetical protein V9G10_09225 [Candidatus Nanopelagicales bacterium]
MPPPSFSISTQQAFAAVDHVAEGGPLTSRFVHIGQISEPGAFENRRGVGWCGGVLDEDRHDLARMGLHPLPQAEELRLELGSAELAQRVAHVDLDRSCGGLAAQPVDGALHRRRDLLRLALGEFGLRPGQRLLRRDHPAGLGALAVPGVDQEHPDPVVETAHHGGRLFGQEPARLIGRGHGVVGGREGDVVEPPVAQFDVSVTRSGLERGGDRRGLGQRGRQQDHGEQADGGNACTDREHPRPSPCPSRCRRVLGPRPFGHAIQFADTDQEHSGADDHGHDREGDAGEEDEPGAHGQQRQCAQGRPHR